MNLKNILILLSITIYSSLTAQQLDCFLEKINDSTEKEEIIKKVKQKARNDIGQLPLSNKKELSEIYTVRAKKLVHKLERGDYYFNKKIKSFFQDIFQQILQANPAIKHEELNLLISRYTYPNAYCMGEGTLVFNLELLPWLENESQIAFILCHELAHHQLDHVNAAIKERINWLNAKETEKELDKIAKSEYGTYDQAIAFLQQNVFKDRRHSRLHETEADALAFQYLKNTQYDAREAVRCLEILDKVDNQRLSTNYNLKQIFDTPQYPFKSHWLEIESSIFEGIQQSDDWTSDSLKTHPDCNKRIAALQAMLPNYKVPPKKLLITNSVVFKALKKQTDFELIQNEFLFQNLGKSLYHSLLLLEKYSDTACLHAMVGKNLYDIHQAQINRQTDDFLERPAPHQKTEYKTLLTFIHNLRLKELARINYHYLKSREAKFINNQSFHYALMLATELMKKEEEYQKLYQNYQKKYSKNEN